MAFGLNRVELIGRLGADVTVNHLTRGGRVANLSVAADESYSNRQSGERATRPSGIASSPSRTASSTCSSGTPRRAA